MNDKNKLLALFIGMWETEPSYYYYSRTESAYTVDEMLFKYDWNWLMDVVEEIVHVCSGNDRLNEWWNNANSSDVRILRLSINDTFDSCVSFVEYYNEFHKSKNK